MKNGAPLVGTLFLSKYEYFSMGTFNKNEMLNYQKWEKFPVCLVSKFHTGPQLY